MNKKYIYLSAVDRINNMIRFSSNRLSLYICTYIHKYTPYIYIWIILYMYMYSNSVVSAYNLFIESVFNDVTCN